MFFLLLSFVSLLITKHLTQAISEEKVYLTLGSSSRLVFGGTHGRVEKAEVTAQPDRSGQP